MERITLSILCELMKELPLEGYTADEITRAFKKGLNLTTQFEYPDEIFNQLACQAFHAHLQNLETLQSLHQQCKYICQPKKTKKKQKSPQILEKQPDTRPITSYKTSNKKKINKLYIEIPKENQQIQNQTPEFNDDVIIIDSNDDEKYNPYMKELNQVVISNSHDQIRLETPTQSVSKAEVQFTFTAQIIKSPQKKVDHEELIMKKKQMIKEQKSTRKTVEVTQSQLNYQNKSIAEPKPKVQQQVHKQKTPLIPIEKKKLEKSDKKVDQLSKQSSSDKSDKSTNKQLSQQSKTPTLREQQQNNYCQFSIQQHPTSAPSLKPIKFTITEQQNVVEKKSQKQDITPIEKEIQKKQKNDQSNLKNGQRPQSEFSSAFDFSEVILNAEQSKKQTSQIVLQQPKKQHIIKSVKVQDIETQAIPIKAAGFKIKTNSCSQCNEDYKGEQYLLHLNKQNQLCYKCCLDGLNPFTKITQKIGILEYKVEDRQTKKQKINFTVDVLNNLNQPSMFVRGIKLEIRCVQLTQKGMQEITFPQNCKIYMNDIPVKQFDPLQEKSCLKKRKDKPIFLSLADLGKYVNNLNGLCFSVDETNIIDPKFRRDEKGSCYYFSLYVTEPQKPEQIIDELLLKKQTQNIKNYFDPDVAIMRTNVSLTCIYDLKLIHIPARGAYCEHSQCFSITNYLEMQMIAQDAQKWYCPICKMSCFHLVIDKYQLKLLDRVRQLGLQIDSIELLPDGQLDQTIEIQRVLLDDEVTTFEQAIQKGYRIQVAKQLSDDEEDVPEKKNKENKIEIIID